MLSSFKNGKKMYHTKTSKYDSNIIYLLKLVCAMWLCELATHEACLVCMACLDAVCSGWLGGRW